LQVFTISQASWDRGGQKQT